MVEQYSAAPSMISKSDQAFVEVLPETHGGDGGSSCSHTVGPPGAASLPKIGEQFSPESQWAQEQIDLDFRVRPSGIEIMKEEFIFDQGGCSGQDSLLVRDDPDRRALEMPVTLPAVKS